MIGLINKAYLLVFLLILNSGYNQYIEAEEKKEQAQNTLASINSKLNRAKKKQEKIKEYFKNIDKKKEEIEVVATQIEALQKKLPSDISDAENISLIRDVADNFKIKNLDISPARETVNGFYITRIYNFSAKATYLQFLLLLEKLAEAERILNVRKVDFKRSSKKDKGRYEIIEIVAEIESYKYNKSHKEDRGISDIEKQFEKKKPVKRKRKKRRKR